MNNSTKLLTSACTVALFACGAFSNRAQAVPITGQVTMAGTATLNNTNLGSATAATAFSGVSVINPTNGSYAGTQGSTVNFFAFAWNPPSTPVNPLWMFTTGTGINTVTYRFDLSSLNVVMQTSSFLNIAGTGTLSISGAGTNFNPTTGAWSFSIVNPGGGPSASMEFGFVSSNNAIPDGGSALALLGISLVSVELLRRRFAAA